MVAFDASDEQWRDWLRLPLELAAARGNLDLVNKLLNAGAKGATGPLCAKNRTLLAVAVSGGNEEVVETLVRAGYRQDVNTSNGEPPLILAARLRHEAVGRSLILAGADVDAQYPRSVVAMHVAAANGCRHLVNDLLLRGSLQCVNRSGRYPLHVAAFNGHAEVIKALLAGGVPVDVLDSTGDSALVTATRRAKLRPMEALLAAGNSLGLNSILTIPALEVAARRGRLDVLRTLLRFGADVLASNIEGWTALHTAVSCNRGKDTGPVIRFLIESGAIVNARSLEGNTPLHCAVNSRLCNVGTVRALLGEGADINAQNECGETPLHLASRRSNVKAVEELLRWDADWTVMESWGRWAADVIGLESRKAYALYDDVMMLFLQAPENQLWRRRGWLVLSRCCPDRVQILQEIVTSCDKTESSKNSNNIGEKETWKGGKGDKRHAESEGEKEGKGGEVVGFAKLVAGVVAIQPDDVFRKVVMFIA